jgi:hypothetical protein
MKKLTLAALTLTILFAACKHQPDNTVLTGNGNTDNGGGGTVVTNPHPCDPDTVYFVNDILPLIISSCAMPQCHDAISHRDGVRLYDYATIIDYVTPGSPNNSELYTVLFDGMPPASSGGALSSAEKQMIRTWILQGGLNNSCIEDCDPNATVTFSGVLWPIVQANCTGCHSGSNPGGGVSLTNYTTVYNSCVNGNFMNSLTATNGVSIMPAGTGGLPSCQIDQFQSWVDAGAPNN